MYYPNISARCPQAAEICTVIMTTGKGNYKSRIRRALQHPYAGEQRSMIRDPQPVIYNF